MALKRIVLRDFVIVSELELEFESGFTALTGETGAGKSILIDALQLVTGARADSSAVREGANRTDVSAEFDSPPGGQAFLAECGFDGGDALLLRRTVDLTGKSRAWINGSPATAQQLRTVGELLLDIHGQHAWQSLTRPDAVRGLLDAYCGVSTRKLEACWHDWKQAQTQLEKALSAQDSLQQERERLAWQIGELDKLKPQADEWEELQSSHNRLSNGQALLDAAQSAVHLLEGDSQGNALQMLHSALHGLQALAHLEADFQNPIEVIESSIAQIDDTVRSLRAYLRHTDLDPQRLAELDERVSLWLSLARRYKRQPQELPALLMSWKTALKALDTASDVDALRSAESTAHAAYLREAKTITAGRTKGAALLSQAITDAMQGLGMQGGQFKVVLEPCSQPARSGLEDAIFLVAAHAGSTPRAVGKVASGGELSRMALAIAVTTSQLGTAQTLIFDEVDSGVGGAVAETVGRLMERLGADRQVFAVTHLPQVAACAHHHLLVAKQWQGTSTQSTVTAIAQEARVREIARMLGGEKLSETTLAHAREMLNVRNESHPTLF